MTPSILVADFDFTRRYVIAQVLRKVGHDVLEVGDAEAAEAALSDHHFALAFVAVRLSGGDGLDLCRTWSERGVPVVLVSSDFRSSELLRARAHEAGAAGQIYSTLDRDHILALASQVMGHATAPA